VAAILPVYSHSHEGLLQFDHAWAISALIAIVNNSASGCDARGCDRCLRRMSAICNRAGGIAAAASSIKVPALNSNRAEISGRCSRPHCHSNPYSSGDRADLHPVFGRRRSRWLDVFPERIDTPGPSMISAGGRSPDRSAQCADRPAGAATQINFAPRKVCSGFESGDGRSGRDAAPTATTSSSSKLRRFPRMRMIHLHVDIGIAPVERRRAPGKEIRAGCHRDRDADPSARAGVRVRARFLCPVSARRARAPHRSKGLRLRASNPTPRPWRCTSVAPTSRSSDRKRSLTVGWAEVEFGCGAAQVPMAWRRREKRAAGLRSWSQCILRISEFPIGGMARSGLICCPG